MASLASVSASRLAAGAPSNRCQSALWQPALWQPALWQPALWQPDPHPPDSQTIAPGPNPPTNPTRNRSGINRISPKTGFVRPFLIISPAPHVG
jgi:hypothetical protein